MNVIELERFCGHRLIVNGLCYYCDQIFSENEFFKLLIIKVIEHEKEKNSIEK